MKRKIVNIFFLLLFSLFTVSAQSYKSSDEILNKVSQKLNQGIEAEFIISRVIDKKNIEEEFSGSIIMKGDKYYLDSPLMKIWYNGLDQWAYNIEDGEVTVSEISPIEENSFNIMSIINNQDKYNIKNLGSETLLGSKYTKVELTTKKNNDEIVFRKVTFLFDKNMMPHSMGIEDRKGDNYILLFSKTALNLKLNDNDFVFPKEKYANVYFNDLR